MTVIDEIKAHSKNWDLDGLKTIAARYDDDPPEEIRAALVRAFGYAYSQMWMDFYDERLQGDPIEIIRDIVNLLTILKRLEPSLERDVQYSGWLQSLAGLHDDADVSTGFLSEARAVIDAAIEGYPDSVGAQIQKVLVLTDLLSAPGGSENGGEERLRESVRRSLSLLTAATAGSIANGVYEVREKLRRSHPSLVAQMLSEYHAAVQAKAIDEPDVVVTAAYHIASLWEDWESPDQRDPDELDFWLSCVDAIPRFDPEAMDRLADEVFQVARLHDPEGESGLRTHFLSKARALYARIIHDHPGFIRAYEDMARVFHAEAQDYRACKDLESAGILLRDGIAWLERIDPDVIQPGRLNESRLTLHREYNEHIDRYRNREHILKTVELLRCSIDARLQLYREVFHNRKKDYYAAYANRDFEELARLQLKCGLTEDAWASLAEWNGIIQEQQALWGYLPRDLGELLRDAEFAPIHERLERLLQLNAESSGLEESTSHEEEQEHR